MLYSKWLVKLTFAHAFQQDNWIKTVKSLYKTTAANKYAGPVNYHKAKTKFDMGTSKHSQLTSSVKIHANEWNELIKYRINE